MEYVMVIGGLIILIAGGELLVRGASAVALKFNISPFIVGMTVVAFGTSAPELLVSLSSALDNHPDIAIGNVIGSNISNIALVLGATALVFPVAIQRNIIRQDWPLLLLATLLFWYFGSDNKLVFWEGVGLFAILLFFILKTILSTKKGQQEISDDVDLEAVNEPIWRTAAMLLLGFPALVYGSNWLIDGAVKIAQNFGVSEMIISLTIVAIGTSLPELVTSIMAARKKETDIAIGNIMGSNIFNILCILGITSMVTDVPVSQEVLDRDIYWLLGITVLLLPMMVLRKNVNRVEGLILLTVYASFLFFLIPK